MHPFTDRFVSWFHSKYEPIEGQCWPWKGALDTCGYGQIHKEGFNTQASRASYQLANNCTLSKKQQVLHSCDNPPCVNPAHLRAGSNSDNMREMDERKRHPRLPTRVGSTSPNAKLTESDIIYIKNEYADGKSGIKLAKELNVSKVTIYGILNNKQWKHV